MEEFINNIQVKNFIELDILMKLYYFVYRQKCVSAFYNISIS